MRVKHFNGLSKAEYRMLELLNVVPSPVIVLDRQVLAGLTRKKLVTHGISKCGAYVWKPTAGGLKAIGKL